MTDSLSDLVTRAKEGDRRAFGRVVEATQQRTFNLAYEFVHNQQAAEDITQEAYLRAWRSLPSFRGEAKFTTWLYRIVVNLCLNRDRKVKREFTVVDDGLLDVTAASGVDPEAAAIDKAYYEWVWSAVEHLPEKYRVAITLFYQEQLSYQEMTRVLSLPLGTIKSHLSRARQMLAARLRLRREVQDG